MERIAVFAGSFDPVTKGHEAIVKRALNVFDKVIVAIGVNPAKKYMFDLEQRLVWLEATFSGESRIETTSYQGLTVEFCKSKGAQYILRGLRNGIDFEYEKTIAQMNQAVEGSVETVFLLTDPEFAAINSTVIRELIRYGEDVSQFLPENVRIS